MRFIILLVLFVSDLSLALADWPYSVNTPTNQRPSYGSKYDYKTGNNYRWNTDTLGNTNIYGNNYSKGTSWNTRIDRSGSMSGKDSNGHNWNYDSNTGSYYNYGTGKQCFGKGNLRTCY